MLRSFGDENPLSSMEELAVPSKKFVVAKEKL